MKLKKSASLFVLASVLLSVCEPVFALYAPPPMSRRERAIERRERDYYEERRLDRMREESELRERARRDQMRWERQREERERREWDRREQARREYDEQRRNERRRQERHDREAEIIGSILTEIIKNNRK